MKEVTDYFVKGYDLKLRRRLASGMDERGSDYSSGRVYYSFNCLGCTETNHPGVPTGEDGEYSTFGCVNPECDKEYTIKRPRFAPVGTGLETKAVTVHFETEIFMREDDLE